MFTLVFTNPNSIGHWKGDLYSNWAKLCKTIQYSLEIDYLNYFEHTHTFPEFMQRMLGGPFILTGPLYLIMDKNKPSIIYLDLIHLHIIKIYHTYEPIIYIIINIPPKEGQINKKRNILMIF